MVSTVILIFIYKSFCGYFLKNYIIFNEENSANLEYYFYVLQ
jgi:hypothetical protein